LRKLLCSPPVEKNFSKSKGVGSDDEDAEMVDESENAAYQDNNVIKFG